MFDSTSRDENMLSTSIFRDICHNEEFSIHVGAKQFLSDITKNVEINIFFTFDEAEKKKKDYCGRIVGNHETVLYTFTKAGYYILIVIGFFHVN